MSDQSEGPGWWMASDGKWHPPQSHPDQAPPPPPPAAAPAASASGPLLQFKSHIDGKNAEVTIYPDRIEWHRLTSALRARSVLGRNKGTEMMPMRAVTSVLTRKDGMRFTKVVVVATATTVEFRVGHSDATAVRDLLTQLTVGSHPSQQP